MRGERSRASRSIVWPEINLISASFPLSGHSGIRPIHSRLENRDGCFGFSLFPSRPGEVRPEGTNDEDHLSVWSLLNGVSPIHQHQR